MTETVKTVLSYTKERGGTIASCHTSNLNGKYLSTLMLMEVTGTPGKATTTLSRPLR